MPKKNTDLFSEPEEHPAFGMISLSKVHCGRGGVVLFGSSVRHHNFIALRIHKANRARTLHRDYIRSQDLLMEVHISPVQLSELLTSLNRVGTPCTLRSYRDADGLVLAEDCPETAKAQKTFEEFQEQVEVAAEKMRVVQEKVREAAKKGTMGKRALERLTIDIGVAAQEIDKNMPFILDSFREKCEETVKDAKGEVEAFVSGIVERTGLKAIAEGAPELPLLGDGDTR